MSKNIRLLTLVACCVIALAACTKPKNTSKADPDAQQHNSDVSNTKSESDNLNTDINSILNEVRGKTDGIQALSICGATIDSSQQNAAIPTIIVNFDGTSACGSPARIRQGQIKIELINGTRWSDQGAKLRVTHNDYKVTFVELDNHYLVFNGVKYLTNVNGFNWIGIYLGTSTATIKERSDNMEVTFENGDTESWNCARLSTWGLQGGQVYAIVNGDSISNGKTIDSWGTTRFGTNFTTEMITPWKSGTACGWWKPTQGKYTSRTDNFTVTATASVDQNGNTVSGCGAYGYKIEWNYANGTATGDAVIPYF
ncbi:MAG TPA: hypothetical protein VK154_00235 [Chitinophagales bacterium]|nr:hypothetical protein [Chitinophagales bacterium]